jgi:GT2 family glycosyltransferase
LETIVTSILIPSFNTRALSVACIRSIEENPPASPYEIILMDNNSSDGTSEEVSRLFPQVRVLQNDENWGVGKACNRAAQGARGKYFLLLNNDVQLLPGTIEQMVQWLDAHPKTGIVGPELIDGDGKLIQMSWGWVPVLHGEIIQRFLSPKALQKSAWRRRLVRYLQRHSRRVPWLCCACALIRREAFDQVRGFDEDFYLYFEDSDLCLRCAERGWQNDFVPEIKAIHHLSQSVRPAFNVFSLIYQQSHIVYYRKHAPFWGIWLLKGYLLLKWLAGGYGPTFLRVVLEKQKIPLPRGAESTC